MFYKVRQRNTFPVKHSWLLKNNNLIVITPVLFYKVHRQVFQNTDIINKLSYENQVVFSSYGILSVNLCLIFYFGKIHRGFNSSNMIICFIHMNIYLYLKNTVIFNYSIFYPLQCLLHHTMERK